MAQEHQKICFGSWMPYRPSSRIYIGQKKSLPNIWITVCSSCQVTWLRQALNGKIVSLVTKQLMVYLKILKYECNFMQDDSFTSHPLLVNSTKGAFESKLTKSSRSTDFRIPLSLCTMFNVMVDAKDQSAKLCAMEMGQEVIGKTSDCCDRQKLSILVLSHHPQESQ